MRVWKERFELLDSTIAPTQTPIDLVDQYHDTPRLRESRSFDADEQYWYISFDVVISVLVCCAALLVFFRRSFHLEVRGVHLHVLFHGAKTAWAHDKHAELLRLEVTQKLSHVPGLAVHSGDAVADEDPRHAFCEG